MPFKIIAGVIGAGLMIAYVAPVVRRIPEFALWAVVGIGLMMMLVDLVQSLKKEE